MNAAPPEPDPPEPDGQAEHPASGFLAARSARYRVPSLGLRAALAAVAVLAAVTVVLPAAIGESVGKVLVAVLVGVPLVRVAWFVVRWFRRGDPKFAMIGFGVLCVVAVGALLA